MMDAEFAGQLAAIKHHLRHGYGVERLNELRAERSVDEQVLESVLDESARFAGSILAPLNGAMDRCGCRLVDGRVRIAPGHKKAWKTYCEGGWPGIDLPEAVGGQGLPGNLAVGAQEVFDRSCVAFGMVSGAARAAFKVIENYADQDTQAEYLPRIAAGEWAATICMSEAGAGSDVGRLTTRARSVGSEWRLDGEKMWISFGDHDLTERIGHIVLARTDPNTPGLKGLSLFLVPSADEMLRRNGVTIRRLDEKMGLHGSPTCAIGFEGAAAKLLGQPGRGISQLFRMIIAMRLQVATQGLGMATGAYQTALEYSRTRRQGGPEGAPPLPLIEHQDIKRMLSEMATRIETLRGLVHAAVVVSELAELEPEPAARDQAAALLGWLLPIVKNSAAETAFEVASQAMLVLGGAGYTTEWPIAQYLRDARILAIYEGTTGMQAIDLVRRRMLSPGTYEGFIGMAMANLGNLPSDEAQAFNDGLRSMTQAVHWLRDPRRSLRDVDSAAVPMLQLATEAAHGWLATRLAQSHNETGAEVRLRACGKYTLAKFPQKMALLCQLAQQSSAAVQRFASDILQ
jgi:3-(methylthio)propanoyl-CoA dehydrogenase